MVKVTATIQTELGEFKLESDSRGYEDDLCEQIKLVLAGVKDLQQLTQPSTEPSS